MNDETRARVHDAALNITTTAWRRRFADQSITPTFFEWRDMALEVGEAAYSEGYQAGVEAAAKLEVTELPPKDAGADASRDQQRTWQTYARGYNSAINMFRAAIRAQAKEQS